MNEHIKSEYYVYHPDCSNYMIQTIKDLRTVLLCDLRTAKNYVYIMKETFKPILIILTDEEAKALCMLGFQINKINRYNITIDDDIF